MWRSALTWHYEREGGRGDQADRECGVRRVGYLLKTTTTRQRHGNDTTTDSTIVGRKAEEWRKQKYYSTLRGFIIAQLTKQLKEE